jgi:hypothetical protein
MSEPGKPEVSEGFFIAAEITLGLEPQQDIRTILEPEQADYTDRGIFLGCFATHREVKLAGGASVAVRGKLYVRGGVAELHDAVVHLDQFGPHPARISAEGIRMLLAGMFVRREHGRFVPLAKDREFQQTLEASGAK